MSVFLDIWTDKRIPINCESENFNTFFYGNISAIRSSGMDDMFKMYTTIVSFEKHMRAHKDWTETQRCVKTLKHTHRPNMFMVTEWVNESIEQMIQQLQEVIKQTKQQLQRKKNLSLSLDL